MGESKTSGVEKTKSLPVLIAKNRDRPCGHPKPRTTLSSHENRRYGLDRPIRLRRCDLGLHPIRARIPLPRARCLVSRRHRHLGLRSGQNGAQRGLLAQHSLPWAGDGGLRHGRPLDLPQRRRWHLARSRRSRPNPRLRRCAGECLGGLLADSRNLPNSTETFPRWRSDVHPDRPRGRP